MTVRSLAQWGVAAGLVASIFIGACGAGDSGGGYVGRAVCAECHADAVKAWTGSHHDLAMQEVTPETVLGDFGDGTKTTEFTNYGVTTTFSRKGDEFFVRTDGPTGKLEDFKIKYVFGFTPLQQYLIEFPRGRLQVLDVCWDTRPKSEGGQRWFHLYQNEPIRHDDPLHWTGRNQNWNYMCAECHSTNLRRGYDPKTDRFHTTWSEINVSCEACHGPGAEHVAWARAGGTGGSASEMKLAIALEKSDPESWLFQGDASTAKRNVPRHTNAQIEMCARCHSRRSEFTDDYVYGHPLGDTHRLSLLAEGLYHADGQIQDEVYVYGSFLQSKMYHNGVICSDCHDPHSLKLRAQGNALCCRCHDAKIFDTKKHHFHDVAKGGTHCVDCHMISRTYMVVDPRRDHSFRVPRPDLSVELGTPNACNDCHKDQKPKWAADWVRKWYGPERTRGADFARTISAARKGEPHAGSSLRYLATDRDKPGIVRATALSLLAPWMEPATLSVVQQSLADDDPLVRHAALGLLDGLPDNLLVPLALPLITDPVRSVRMEAARVLAGVRELPAKVRKHFDAALGEYLAGEWFNSNRPEARVNIGAIYARRGQLDKALAAYKSALALEPGLVTATVNLADLYKQLGREADGQKLLEDAIAKHPEEPSLQHALAFVLVRRGHKQAALKYFEKSARLGKDVPRYAHDYAVALNSLGRPDKALQVLREAYQRHPASRDILFALATMHRDRGQRDAALVYAKKLAVLLPSDTSAQQLIDEIEGKRSGR